MFGTNSAGFFTNIKKKRVKKNGTRRTDVRTMSKTIDNRVSIVTHITGNYRNELNKININNTIDGFKHYIISDQILPKKGKYINIKINLLNSTQIHSKRRTSKYIKFGNFENTGNSEWIYHSDCHRGVNNNYKKFIIEQIALRPNADIIFVEHPNRNCVSQEIEICKNLGIAGPYINNWQEYVGKKYDDIPLPDTCLFLRKRVLSDKSRKALDELLAKIDEGLFRDQTVIGVTGAELFRDGTWVVEKRKGIAKIRYPS